MKLVLWVFETLAGLLAAGGVVALLRAGVQAAVFRTVGRWLLALAGVTAVYPALLGPLGPWAWAGGYAAIVAALTAGMTIRSVHAARRLARRTA